MHKPESAVFCPISFLSPSNKSAAKNHCEISKKTNKQTNKRKKELNTQQNTAWFSCMLSSTSEHKSNRLLSIYISLSLCLCVCVCVCVCTAYVCTCACTKECTLLSKEQRNNSLGLTTAILTFIQTTTKNTWVRCQKSKTTNLDMQTFFLNIKRHSIQFYVLPTTTTTKKKKKETCLMIQTKQQYNACLLLCSP